MVSIEHPSITYGPSVRDHWGSTTLAPEVQRIADFMTSFSIETLPAVSAKTDCYRALLPQGTSVYIAYIPGSDPGAVIATARRLTDEGLNPVPHVPARTLTGRQALEDYLARLTGEAGVSQVMAVGGDRDVPAGDFDCTMRMLETGLFDRFGIRRIGVAGHPDGNRAIGPAGLEQAVRDKNRFAERTDADLYIVTQFCFDAARVIAWDRTLRAAGNVLPIHIGLAGPAKLQALIKYATLCGVATSARMMSKQAFNLARMSTTAAPDEMVRALADYRAEDPDCGIVSAHFYTFGGLSRATSWIACARQGDITPTKRGFRTNHPID